MESEPKGQIVAMGGGGFSMEDDNTLLDDFVLSLCPSPSPRVCFVPTAAADAPSYITRFYRAFAEKATPTDPVIEETIRRCAPTLNFAGQTAMDNALDEELQAALTGQKSAEDAMKDAAKRWKRIIQRKGEDRTLEAIQASRAAWPSIIDDA
jgi:hypothetical protein